MNVVARAKTMLVAPAAEWRAIEKEPGDPVYLFANYVAVLALIPAVAGFIGTSIVGVSVPGAGTVRVPLVMGLFNAIFSYVLTFVMVYVVALIIDALAPIFEGQKNFTNALRLSVYSCTPLWVAGLFMIIPGLRFLVVLGFYGFYVLWSGLPPLMKSPHGKSLLYAACVVTSAFLLVIVFGAVQGALLSILRGA
jgi:hypothetical protein